MTLSSCTLLCPSSLLSASTALLVLSSYYQGNQTKLALQMLSLQQENSLLIEVGKHALKLHCAPLLANASQPVLPSFSQRVTFACRFSVCVNFVFLTNVSTRKNLVNMWFSAFKIRNFLTLSSTGVLYWSNFIKVFKKCYFINSDCIRTKSTKIPMGVTRKYCGINCQHHHDIHNLW